MAEPQGSGNEDTSRTKRKGNASKHAMATQTQEELGSSPIIPCGACKFLRRKCIDGCIFAPYFGTEQGATKFAAVHKVFGASNVSKLLSNIPANYRNQAAGTISYEAQARLSDPIFGCVSTIFALQQQVASLQAELAMAQNQMMNNRFTYGSALQTTQLQQPNINATTPHPVHSNNSSGSTNFMNLSNFTNNLNYNLAMEPVHSSHSLVPLHFSRLSQYEEEDEEESKTQHVFNQRH